jgi:hypothetical protein
MNGLLSCFQKWLFTKVRRLRSWFNNTGSSKCCNEPTALDIGEYMDKMQAFGASVSYDTSAPAVRAYINGALRSAGIVPYEEKTCGECVKWLQSLTATDSDSDKVC